MLPAFTDSRTFRAAFPECVAYGFFPQRAHDPLRDLAARARARRADRTCATSAFAARCYRDVTKELLG